MDAKRPDQHNIDPADGSSGDRQRRSEGQTTDEQLVNQQKEKLASDSYDASKGPEKGADPAARAQREKKGARGKDESVTSDDDRVDEASRESFPASDPPSYP